MRPAPVVLIEIGKADEQTLCGLLLPLVGSEGFKMKDIIEIHSMHTKNFVSDFCCKIRITIGFLVSNKLPKVRHTQGFHSEND